MSLGVGCGHERRGPPSPCCQVCSGPLKSETPDTAPLSCDPSPLTSVGHDTQHLPIIGYVPGFLLDVEGTEIDKT